MSEWVGGDAGKYLTQRPGIVGTEKEHRGKYEGQIAEAVGEERPKRITMRGTAAHVLTQQKVQQHAYKVPCNQESYQVSGAHHQQEGGCHQVEHCEEARIARLLSHIAHGIDVNDQADTRYHERQQCAQRIDGQDAPCLRKHHGLHCMTAERLPQKHRREKKSGRGTGHADPGNALREAAGCHDREQRSHQRQCDQ